MKKFILPFMVLCAALCLSQSASAENYQIATITSNMSVYESNTLDKLKDNDFSTKFWSSKNQASGDYILVDLGDVRPLQEINLYFLNLQENIRQRLEAYARREE